jgi:hypothetical protein
MDSVITLVVILLALQIVGFILVIPISLFVIYKVFKSIF